MKTPLTAFAVAALAFAASRAEAQVVVSRAPQPSTSAFAPATYPTYSITPAVAPPAGTIPGYLPPYSYYAAPYGLPARQYVGYGSNDYPFYGRPYGHPYDLWTWPYMAGGYYGPLARYYYPPL